VSERTRGPGGDSLPSDELRSQLDAWQPPAARPEFRAELRERFLGSAVSESDVGLTDAELTSRLADHEPPPARSEFRARLRERFLGAGGSSRRHTTIARRPSLRVLAPVLAAAASLVLLLWAPWRGDPSFVLNGQLVSYAESEVLGSSIEHGECELSVGDEDLRVLTLDDGVFLEFPAGTDLRVLPRAQGESGLLELEVQTGGVRVSTREDFEGRILVHTPDAVISLSGPSVGIDVMPQGTCLCILEGVAEMSGKGQGARSRRVVGGEMAFFERGEADFRVRDELYHVRELETFARTSERYLF
jgi:ferric-dicitrate binding protein FerR (iron transport regulator)